MTMLDCLQKGIDGFYRFTPRFKKPIPKDLKVVAHRGVFDNWAVIENSYAAFDKALNYRVWGIELDIHESMDGHFIVNHDLSLERLWGERRSIGGMRLEEIQAVSQQIPTLDEVIKRYSRHCHLFIELKSTVCNEKVLADSLIPLTPCADYHFLTLDEAIFSSLRLFPRESMLLVPQLLNAREFCHLCDKKGYGGVMGHYLMMTKSRLAWLKARSKLAGVGFVDSKNQLYREVGRELDYLFSNDIPAIQAILTSR